MFNHARRSAALAVPILSTLLLAAAIAAPAGAAIITINGTGDAVAVDGDCTLREAIEAANGDADVNECVRTGAASPDEIHFAITGPGPHVIQPQSALPAITESVVVDGTTQAGTVCPGVLVMGGEGQMVPSPGDLRIVVNGADVGGSADGLFLATDDSTVRGLVVNGFADGFGIHIEGSNNHLECNFVGTDASGSAADANLDGVGILASEGSLYPTDNVIGVLDGAGYRNVISGNVDDGIQIGAQATTANTVAGNIIGLDATGGAAVPNRIGVNLDFAENSVVGTDGDSMGDAEERNVISGNTAAGVQIQGDGNVVAGNYIGTNVAGNCQFDPECSLGNGIGVVLGVAPFEQSPGLRTRPAAGRRKSVVGREVADGGALVKENLITENGTGILITYGEVVVPLATDSSDNCVVANESGVVNDLDLTATFEGNWWGAADGPSPPGGMGSGDSVVGDVDFEPFLMAPAAACSGTITIAKDAVPDGPQDFQFTLQRIVDDAPTGSPVAFALDDDGGSDATNPSSRTFNVEAGTYWATEADPTGVGFHLSDLQCDDSLGGGMVSTGNTDTRTAVIHLEPGETVTCTFTDTLFGLIGIEKSTNGVDADDPPGPSVPVGDPISWTYVVTNLGEVTLSAITVTDDQGVAVSCPSRRWSPANR